MRKVSFIGLGVMGYPMAGHLARCGFEVKVYNRTLKRAKDWVQEFGGEFVITPAEAADGAEIVFMCVGNDSDIREVTKGKSGIFEGLDENAIFVDHTTASAIIARELFEASLEIGCAFLDAPVSGGQVGAENGLLTVMVGGEEDSFQKAKTVIESYAQKVALMGPAGSGQLTKMVNQICIAGLLEGLSEGLSFAMQAGLSVEAVLDVISKGAAQSWQMENRGLTMHQDKFDFGFAVDWMRKDLNICLDEARRNGSLLPVTALVNEFYGNIQRIGGGRWDTSSLIRLLQDSRDN
ncbi:MAG: oxidoreductase [Acidiferrobacteraceae bacterium]|nr:oxidoreductase [Acidiferrobacteraceae bacterium]